MNRVEPKYLPCELCGVDVKISDKYRWCAKTATCLSCVDKLYEEVLRRAGKKE